MQENEFEKNIREKMEGLQLVPSDEVWKRVSANIKEDKKRRRFLWFLLSATLLAGSGALYLYFGSAKTPSDLTNLKNHHSSTIAKNKVKSEIITEKINGHVPGDKMKSDSGIPKDNTTSSTSNSTINLQAKQEHETVNKKLPERSYRAPDFKRTFFSKNGKNTLKVESRQLGRVASTERITQAEDKETVNSKENRTDAWLADKNDIKIEKNEKDSAFVKPALKNENALGAKKDSVKLPIEAKAGKIKDVVNKRWNIGFTIFSGISNNQSGFSLFPHASQLNASVPNQPSPGSNPPPTGSNNAPVGTLNYKTGFSYGVGIYLKSSLGKRTGFTAGLSYHYLSAISLVGNRNSSSQSFYDPNLQFSAIVDQYFTNGVSVKYTNGYHLVGLPLNFLLQLNKKLNKPVFITAGLSPAYLVKSNALYASSSQNVYYVTGNQFKKWQFAAQLGLQVNIINARQFGIAAGPEVQYGLNNMAKQVTGTSQHLVSASLKLNVNLK